MLVAFVGDTHGNKENVKRVLARATEAGAATVVQVGDFGLWPRTAEGRWFLASASKHAVERGIEIHWIDGNHEDHDSLPHDTATEPVEIHPNLIWHPRGTVSMLGDKKVLWMGGAVSIDKYGRTPRWDWFENEVPSRSEWERAFGAGEVDVLISHDAPSTVEMKSHFPDGFIPSDLLMASQGMRRTLGVLCETVKPSVVIHGHWHRYMLTILREVSVLSLGDDRGTLNRQVQVLDTEDLVHPLSPANSLHQD